MKKAPSLKGIEGGGTGMARPRSEAAGCCLGNSQEAWMPIKKQTYLTPANTRDSSSCSRSLVAARTYPDQA